MEFRKLNSGDAGLLLAYRRELERENCDTIAINTDRPATLEMCRSYVGDRSAILYGAIEDGVLIGMLNLDIRQHPLMRHTANLGLTMVEGWRGKGIGSILLDSALKDAVNHGIEIIDLTVLSNNRALALYIRKGFAQVGRRANVIRRNGRYFDEIIMQRSAFSGG